MAPDSRVAKLGRKNKQKRLITFCRKILNCLEKAGVRKFSSRFSKKTYSRPVHVVLLALRQSWDKSYRRFVEQLECSTEILAFLGLEKAPHFTTLQKAAARFGTAILNRIIGGFNQLTRNKNVRLGIDSTGLQPTRASAYYTTVLKRQNKPVNGKKKPPGPGRRKIRKHIKHTALVDLDKQLIVSQKTRRGPASDHKDFKPSVREGRRVLKRAGKKVKSFDADKGYDSEENHRFVVEVLGAEDRMKLKNRDLPVSRTGGRYRKKAKKRIKRLRANYRAKNETVFSVEKRICGSTVRSVKVRMQNREVLFKDIAYNAHRLASIFAPILEDFYRAHLSISEPV